jgi:hypothetical protein
MSSGGVSVQFEPAPLDSSKAILNPVMIDSLVIINRLEMTARLAAAPEMPKITYDQASCPEPVDTRVHESLAK